jgi:5-methylcytosine-specific restriction protein A
VHGGIRARERRMNEPGHQWYGTARWQALRRQVLNEQPLCDDCASKGYITEAREVDHTVPHRGNLKLFFDRSNLSGKCSSCHAVKTRAGL